MEALGPRQWPTVVRLCMGKAPYAVLNDHHGAIDDDAEVQRSQAHQVGAHLVLDHTREGEEHRQGDDHCRDDGGADVAQKEEQDHDHENRALQQVLLHRADGFVNKHGTVVDGHRVYPLWEALVDFQHLLVHRLRDGPAVLTDQHEHRAEDHFAPVVGCGTGAQLSANAHLCHVAHAHRNTIGTAQDHVANVFQRFDLTGRANEVLLAALFDIARAHVAVIAVQRSDYILQCHAQGCQSFWDGCNLVLLGKATNGVDLGHAWNISQLWLDDPVLNLAQVCRGIGGAVRLLRPVLGFYSPEIDSAQPGRDGPQRWRDACRQLVTRLLDALVDELARKVDVGSVLEDDGHLRQAVPRKRPGLLQVGQASHDRLDGVCNPLLSLQRRVTCGLGVDLNLDVRDVRDRVDGQFLVAEDAKGRHAQRRQQNQPSLLDRESNEFFKHVCAPRSVRVFGRSLAEFGLHNEAAGRGVGHAGFETREDFDPLAIASAQLHRLGDKASINLEEDHRLFPDVLDGVGRDGYRRCRFFGHHLNIDKQAGAPSALGVVKNHAGFCRAGLLANERSYKSDSACSGGVKGGGLDRDLFAHTNRWQIFRRNVDLSPHLRKIRDGENRSIFLHRFAETQVLLDDDSVKGRSQLDTVQSCYRRGGQTHCAQFLISVGDCDLCFTQGLFGLQVVLLGRHLLLPQLFLSLVGGPGQRQTFLCRLQLAALLGGGWTCD